MNPIWAHAIVSVVAIVGLVVVNIFGKESAALIGFLTLLLGGGIWGAVQRQKWPVGKDSVDLMEKENADSKKAELKA